MKAIVYKKYGPPDVLHYEEVPTPRPLPGQILVRVYGSTVNRTDTGFRSAEYFISRFWSGLLRPKFPIPGCEFSGIVEETGSNVSLFKKGDRVFGYNDKSFGGNAEYLAINETDAVALIPKNIDIYDAAALTEGAHYALNNIRAAKVQTGQNVLVYGATGAIGSSAVQLLKHFKANVTAVCNSKNIGLIKSLGADTVIDYEKEDFTKLTTRFDFIFDAVGKSSFGACKPLLVDKGIYISTELGKNGENILYALTTPIFGRKKLLFPIPTMTKGDAEFLRLLAEQGMYKPVIDRYYPLDQTREAHIFVQSGQKTGNVVIKCFSE